MWSDVSGHVTLVSVAGGERDVMIPTHLTSIPGAITISVRSINWYRSSIQKVRLVGIGRQYKNVEFTIGTCSC